MVKFRVEKQAPQKGHKPMTRSITNLHKRKDGRWEGRVKIGTADNGRAKYRSVYGKTYAQAKEKLLQAQLESEKPQMCDPLFSEVFAAWLQSNSVRLKGASVYKYRDLAARHLLPALGALPLSRLTPERLNALLEQKLRGGNLKSGRGLSAAYVKTLCCLLHAVLSDAADRGLCAPLPPRALKKPLPRRAEITILTPAQQCTLTAACLAEKNETGLGVFLTLYAGLRMGEVCGLRWQDIDLEHRILSVRHTIARVACDGGSQFALDTPKTKTSLRQIPLCAPLYAYLCEMHPADAKAEHFVLTGTNRFLSPRAAAYRFAALLRRCGMPPLHYHVLRHTFASRCVESGIDVKSLSELLGHANAAVTLNIYVHSSLEQKRAQLERLSAFLHM